jgi:hypothetical protein
MFRSLKVAAVFSGALVAGIFLGATSNFSRAYADTAPGAASPVGKSQAKEPAPDPKKKMAGEACKSSDECQTHHTCAKVADKSICQAPPRNRLPPGAVT